MIPRQRTVFLGNCTTGSFTDAFRIMMPSREHVGIHVTAPNDPETWNTARNACSPAGTRVFVVDSLVPDMIRHCPDIVDYSVVPGISFWGFHPDVVYVGTSTGWLLSGIGTPWNSRLALSAYLEGIDAEECVRFFNSRTFGELGYFDAYVGAVGSHRARFGAAGVDAAAWLDAMAPQGNFLHGPNHPYASGIGYLAFQIARREGFSLDRNLDFHRPEFWTSYLTDYLHRIVWPVYPEIAEHLGVPGAYLFRNEAQVVDLKEFVVACYEKWDAAALDRSQLSGGQFDSLVNRSRLHRDGLAS